MCGICGYWRPGDPLPDAPAIIDDMCAAIVHRGPDGQGSYVDPSVGLAMGHTRLAIIGLEDGQQPLVSRDGMTALTVNGEFYGYKRIRAELAADGERMRTATDSEIAIGLHRRLGREFVHRLRGEFAFALYDKREDELLLVRDRFGVRPLYVHINDDECIWGSEIKALLAHPRCPRELSRRAALHQLMQVMVPGETAFEGIQAVRPGQMLRIRREGGRLVARAETYWDLDFPLAGDHEAADDATAARFVGGTRDRLIDAVGVRLEADVPVGCYLSGGIDSCSILGLAAPQQQSPITAFTIAFDDDRYDESRIARDMARTVGARQIILHVDAARLYGDSFTSVVRHAERTFYNTLSVAKWQMSRRVREEGFKVVLTGEGSDELFGGYPFFKRDMFIHGGPDQAVHREAMERSNALFGGAILSEDAQNHPAFDDLCGFTPSWVQPWMETLSRAPAAVGRPARGTRRVRPHRGHRRCAGCGARARAPSPGHRPVHMEQDPVGGADPHLGRRQGGHGARAGVPPGIPRPPAGRVRRHHPAGAAYPRRCREVGAPRGREGRAARRALHPREVPVHGTACAHRRCQGPWPRRAG